MIGSARAFKTISGPIPAGSPMVTAMIGLLGMAMARRHGNNAIHYPELSYRRQAS
jgi:hypothetical protein